ncbi:MAG: cell division protein CrgA [Acidimicrobiales bacterium]|nr:cell division protein CrgA [Acidimicrobiales bacterium]
MAKPAKRKVSGKASTGSGSGGRVTPKGGAPSKAAAAKSGRSGDPKASSSRTTPAPTSRYTPPVPSEYKVSPRWVPILMFTLLGLGMVMIFCNYLGLVPGGTSNWYLLGGLGLILGGIITATQYH